MITYDLGNLADWVSAAGTISAVVVALYLSRKELESRGRISVKFSYLVYSENIDFHLANLSMQFVNTGRTAIHLKEATIKKSLFSKDRMVFQDGSNNVDKLVQPGEFYEHILDYEPIRRYYTRQGKKRVKTIAYFSDTSGKEYKKRITLQID